MSEFNTGNDHSTIKKALRIGAAASIIGGIGAGYAIAQEAEKGPHYQPSSIKNGGIIEIMPHPGGVKPLKFRDRSWVPDRGSADNSISQDEVNLPEGQTAASVEHFYVKNYMLEEGFNPDRGENSSSKGVWLVFREADGSMTRMSLSATTAQYWKVIVEGKTQPGHLDSQGNFALNNGKSIENTEVSQVSLDLPLANQPNP